jgi:hypothetical protein
MHATYRHYPESAWVAFFYTWARSVILDRETGHNNKRTMTPMGREAEGQTATRRDGKGMRQAGGCREGEGSNGDFLFERLVPDCRSDPLPPFFFLGS